MRFERPPEISAAVSGPPLAPSTCAANHGCEPFEVDSLRRVRHAQDITCPTRCGRHASVARCDGLAVAAGVAGDPTDGHVDAEAGGGALFFGLATPEAVLAVLAGPVAASVQRAGTRRHTARACASRTTRASGRSPAGAKNSRDSARGRRLRKST